MLRRRARRRRQAVAGAALVAVVAVVATVTAVMGQGTEESDEQRAQRDTEVPCPAPDGSSPPRNRFPRAPGMCIDPARSYRATIETDAGTFTVALDSRQAPGTVNNFVFLARYHYFDDTPFHRVIPGFVVQGGDGERGDGTGGPGYTIRDELPQAGQYQVGSVAMANTGAPDSGGSQFFVVTGPQGASLPPQYALFGTVVEGLDVVQRIEADGSQGGTPKVTHRITRVTIAEN